jgi:hypothetical protein
METLNKLPELDKGHPIFGSIHLFAKDPLKFFSDYQYQYDGIFRVKSRQNF